MLLFLASSLRPILHECQNLPKLSKVDQMFSRIFDSFGCCFLSKVGNHAEKFQMRLLRPMRCKQSMKHDFNEAQVSICKLSLANNRRLVCLPPLITLYFQDLCAIPDHTSTATLAAGLDFNPFMPCRLLLGQPASSIHRSDYITRLLDELCS